MISTGAGVFFYHVLSYTPKEDKLQSFATMCVHDHQVYPFGFDHFKDLCSRVPEKNPFFESWGNAATVPRKLCQESLQRLSGPRLETAPREYGEYRIQPIGKILYHMEQVNRRIIFSGNG
jgi:hypothetical protein